MKTRTITLFIAIFAVFAFGSHAFSQEHQQQTVAQKMTIIGKGEMKYTCPMQEHMVFSSEPGECPKCGMKLVEMTPEQKANMQKMMQKMHPESGKPITVTGEVISTACFLRGEMKGEMHKACAQMCADVGIPLAILDESTNKIYLPIPAMGKNPNEKLLPFIAERVTVTGTYLEKGGLSGIDIKTIEKAKKQK